MVNVCTRRLPRIRGGAMFASKQWPNGCRIAVGFLDGTPEQHARVIPYFREWEAYANLTFQFIGNLDNTQARISFADGESWAYVGTEAQAFGPSEPTLGFGWINEDTPEHEVRRVVLHEVGHLIGCEHELQQPAADFDWDREVVYKYYEGPPNNWGRDLVDQQVFAKITDPAVEHTAFDPLSIMAYAVPPSWDKRGRGVPFNLELSEMDKIFARRMYPTEIVQ